MATRATELGVGVPSWSMSAASAEFIGTRVTVDVYFQTQAEQSARATDHVSRDEAVVSL